jgi:RNA recognition motif-containing protein
VNRIIYVRNLPFKITSEELYDLFGKYGPVYQIRVYVESEFNISP